jgi:ADP-ribose pyrophosphatase
MKPMKSMKPMKPMERTEEKVNAAAHGWERLSTKYPFDYHMFRIRQDEVRWPDGQVRPYAYVQASGAVWVVPVTADNQVILIRQFRYTIDDWCWEVVAGGFHDFDGSPVELARRELAEEIGGSSDDLTYIGCYRAGVSIVDEVCHIVLARDVRLDSEPHREPGEIIEVHTVPLERALEMARNGEMVDGHSALAILRCEPHLIAKDGD